MSFTRSNMKTERMHIRTNVWPVVTTALAPCPHFIRRTLAKHFKVRMQTHSVDVSISFHRPNLQLVDKCWAKWSERKISTDRTHELILATSSIPVNHVGFQKALYNAYESNPS